MLRTPIGERHDPCRGDRDDAAQVRPLAPGKGAPTEQIMARGAGRHAQRSGCICIEPAIAESKQGRPSQGWIGPLVSDRAVAR